MEPSGLPPSTGMRAPVSLTARPGLPTLIVLGLVLAGIGILLTGAAWAWNYFAFRTFNGSFTAFFQVQILLTVVEGLCLQIGLFLILTTILSMLPGTGPWSRLGPILILVGALVAAAVGLGEFALEPLAFSGGAMGDLAWLFDAISVAILGAYVATTLGLILSLFAVAKAVRLRSSPAAMYYPP